MTHLSTGARPEMEEPPRPPSRTSGMAIASLACGIAGPCTAGLSSIVGIVLGAVALPRINRSAGELSGRGIAIAGIVASVIGLIVGLLILIVVLATYYIAQDFGTAQAPLPPPQDEAVASVQALCRAAMGYASLNDGRLPPADSWLDDLGPYLRDDGDRIVGWPKASGRPLAYCMNQALAGTALQDIAYPERTVLFFITAAGGNIAGGPADLVDCRDGMPLGAFLQAPFPVVIGFADGHAEEVEVAPAAGKTGGLLWDAQGTSAADSPPTQ